MELIAVTGSPAPWKISKMKLMKKQLSTSYVMQATVLPFVGNDDVANHGDSRLDRCPMASPFQGKVEFTAHISFARSPEGYEVHIWPREAQLA
jgi:hypothetical protein